MAEAGIHVIEDLDRANVVLHPLRLRLLGELEEPDSAAGVARRLGLKLLTITTNASRSPSTDVT
jgi:hypothetical protein